MYVPKKDSRMHGSRYESCLKEQCIGNFPDHLRLFECSRAKECGKLRVWLNYKDVLEL